MSAPPPLPASLAPLAPRLRAAGLDLLQAFDGAAYDRARPAASGLAPLDLFDRASALALLVGNTRALWPPLREALARDPALAACEHPLDTYVTRVLLSACADLPLRHHLYLAHLRAADPSPPIRPELVSMTRAAAAAGLACLSPAGLAVHPDHGPWFALRALLVCDAPPPPASPPRTEPCAGCPAPCRAPLARATEATSAAEIADTWHLWLAVRDACPVGRSGRYGEAQIRYHYTKDRTYLP